MTENSLTYSNARIKCMENRLLTQDKLVRMMDCTTLDEAVKILNETGYGGGTTIDNSAQYDKLLLAEEREVTDLVRTLITKGSGIDCLLLRNDYHNAKAFYKLACTKGNMEEELFKPQGIIELDIIRSAIETKNYDLLPKEMGEALLALNGSFKKGEGTPRQIDVALDKAYYKQVAFILRHSRGYIKSYFEKTVDYSNIASFHRCRNNNLDFAFFESLFLEGGKIAKEKFAELYDMTAENVADNMRNNEYGIAFRLLTESNGGEKMAKYGDDDIVALLKANKADMFSSAPIVGYYLGKLTEIKAVRLILVCIAGAVDKKIIKQRLRELYA